MLPSWSDSMIFYHYQHYHHCLSPLSCSRYWHFARLLADSISISLPPQLNLGLHLHRYKYDNDDEKDDDNDRYDADDGHGEYDGPAISQEQLYFFLAF